MPWAAAGDAVVSTAPTARSTPAAFILALYFPDHRCVHATPGQITSGRLPGFAVAAALPLRVEPADALIAVVQEDARAAMTRGARGLVGGGVPGHGPVRGADRSKKRKGMAKAAEESAKYEAELRSPGEIAKRIKALEEKMYALARDLEFEAAAQMRDEISKLRERLITV